MIKFKEWVTPEYKPMTKEEFKAKRLELGLTQAELEIKLGFSSNTGRMIRNYESGSVPISKRTKMQLTGLK